MFDFLRRWCGLAGNPVADDRQLAVRYDRLADLPGSDALRDKMMAVCHGRQLALTTDGTLPERLASGETCWVLPKDDVTLPVQITTDDRTIRADVRLRFEADHAFALFVSGNDQLTKDELTQLVAGQWLELMALECIDGETLLSGDTDAIARFRTHLSLLLQEYGFRCAGIEKITEVAPEKTDPAEIMPSAPALPNEAKAELQTAIGKVKTEKDWELLLDQLDNAGFEPDTQMMVEIATLGDDYLTSKISPDEATLKIRRMIERKNLEIAAIQRETRYWNATDVKLRLLDMFDDDMEEYLLAAAADNLPKSGRVPSTWYMLRKHKIDAKLQKYLRIAMDDMLKLLESAKNRQSDVVAKAKLAKPQATLNRISDHLTTMPTLTPRQSSLKSKQRDLAALLTAVRRSVSASQLATGLLRKLATDRYSQEDYAIFVRDLENSLDLLENELRERKNVYVG